MEQLLPTAVIPPLSQEECEYIYWDLIRYLGPFAQNELTKLFITQRELRKESVK